MTKFVSIVSGKGGVGKTTSAINLAAALSGWGKEVLIVDGNIATPDVGLQLGISKFATTLHDVLKGAKTMRDAVYIHSSGIKFVPASISIDETRRVSMENFHEVILDLYGSADIVLIDCPAGIGDDAQNVIKASDEVIIVTNPDIPSVTDAMKIARIARENSSKIYGAIITRSFEKNDISPENISVLLDTQILGIIPEDMKVKKALSMKQPVVFSHPESESSVAYKKIAAAMLGQNYDYSLEKRGFFAKLFMSRK